MTEPTIVCPKCHVEIRLTESLAAPLLEATRRQFESRLAQKDEEVAQREENLRTAQRQVEATRAQLQQQVRDQVAAQLQAERPALAAEEATRAKLATAAEADRKARDIAALQGALAQSNAKLAESQKSEADYLKKQRDLDDAKRELELTIQKRVGASVEEIRKKARQEADDSLGLKVAEKDQVIGSMRKQIEELQRKAEQGSQQLQGEVQELELEHLLTARFARDTITPVPKGEFGGDVVQSVMSALGTPCGTILWETKRTRNWSDGWLVKLREDQRAAKADIAVIVSHALPRDVQHFDLIDAVYVVSPRCIIPVATTLRQALIEVATARQSVAGQQTKMELVYQYLTGQRFRQRIQAIVEAFSSMQADLAAERKVIQKQWSKREMQIERVMESTAGLYGDLQGIAGRTLQEIEGLSLDALEGPEPPMPL